MTNIYHTFSSTAQAYNSTMCSDDISKGDILLIESEEVVALAWAWPVAVTANIGSLHGTKTGNCLRTIREDEYQDNAGEQVFTEEQISNAEELALKLGYKLNH